MRYAIFSDIHGNREAWDRVLEDISEMEAEALVCLGDIVGYGPLPQDVLASVRRHTENIVLGNHDAAACGLLDTAFFHEKAREVLEWTKEQLTDESLAFLRDVPYTIEAENILFVHAEIEKPPRFHYIEETEDAAENFPHNQHFVTFVGHTHYPTIFELNGEGAVEEHPDDDCVLTEGNRYIINVGSVGEPRHPEDIRARYVIYDSDTREVIFRRVEFNPEAYRAHLAATTLEIKPYFLRVIDQQVQELEDGERYALMRDMQIPVASLDYLNAYSQAKESAEPAKPKIVVRRRRNQMSAGVVVLLILGLLAFIGGLGWFLFNAGLIGGGQ